MSFPFDSGAMSSRITLLSHQCRRPFSLIGIASVSFDQDKTFFFKIKTRLQVFLPLLGISFLCGDSTNITRQQQPVDFWGE